MRTAFNLFAILCAGLILGLIARSMRSTQPTGPGPDEAVYFNEVAPGEDPLVESPDEIENADVIKPPTDQAWLSRFELTERSGETVTSEDLLGQPYVVSFFFSVCPSICPQQNNKIKGLQQKFAGRDVKFVSITVDPERDTPEVLREYAARFGADKDQWLFLTGELDYIRRVGAEIFQQPVDKAFHTEKLILVDETGAIEGVYAWPEERQFEKLQSKIEEMI